MDVENKKKWILRLYSELNLTPIPIKKQSKQPNLDKGILKEIYRERPGLATINNWIDSNRYDNVAILLGKEHGNLVCFDFDSKKSSDIAKVKPYVLVKDNLWVQETPGGTGRYHVIMRDVKPNETNIKTKYNVEYRSNLHYILIYPSINSKGNQYKLLNLDETDWKDLQLPKETDVDRHWNKIQEMLSDVLEDTEPLQNKVKEKKEFESSADCIKNALTHGASKGERNSTILALASWMKQSGIPYDWGFDSIKEWVRTKCSKGKDLNLTEILKSFDQGYKKDYVVGCTFWRDNTKFCPYADKKDCEFFRPDWHDKTELMNKYNVLLETKRGLKVNHVGLAKLILNEHGYHFKTIVDEGSGKSEIYYYKQDDGYYKLGGEAIARNLIQDYLDEHTSIHKKTEVLSFIKDSSMNFSSEFEPKPHLLNLRNGVYDLNKDCILPHSYEYGFINQLPILYDKNAECPKILEFFAQIFPGSYEDYIKVVQEMFGFTFYRDYFLHVGFILYGRGRNGKGVTVNLLCNMLGRDNYSTRQLHDLIGYQFAMHNLYGKMANISAEVSSRELNDTANFKALTGGEPVTADMKHKGTVTFKNYAKLIFNANEIPKTHDKSFAFYQRWKIIVFSQTFPRGGTNTIPGLAEILSTDTELSGLFNWSLEGLRRLRKRNDFTDASHAEEDDELYELLSNPEITFIDRYIEVNSDSKLSKDEVYNRYYMWCENHRYPITTKNTFTKLLCAAIPETDPRASSTQEDSMGRLKFCYAYGNIGWVDGYIRPKVKRKDRSQDVLEV